LGAPGLLAPAPEGDYILSAHVVADLRTTFDAGALIVWQDERTWAKLAVELCPQGRPTVVSVVTRTRSDDCNSITLAEPHAVLRVARIDEAFAFHVHLDGSWQLIRHFWLGDGPVRPGFLAQSPAGPGCTARFREVVFEPRRLGDVRDGT
jgi:regulation of enolase protein 1 (concanavalin A-like superfamily)